MRSGKAETPADLVSESKRSLGIRRQVTRLSGGVRAGTRTVAPTTRRPRASTAAYWGPPPRGAGPSPHAWWTAAPHGWWRGHSARGRRSTRWRTNSLSQHGRCTDFLSVNLTSIHVFEGLLSLIGSLKLHISITPGEVWVDPVHWQIDHFDFSISGKDLLDVVLGDVPGQPP